MAGEIGAFVIGTDVIGGAASSGYAGGALPGTFNIVSGMKPEAVTASRADFTVPQVKPEASA